MALEAVNVPAMYDYYRQAIPDKGMLGQIFSYLCGCLMVAAWQGGLPLDYGAALSGRWLHCAEDFDSVSAFVDALLGMQQAFAAEVRRHREYQTGHAVLDKCVAYIYEHTGKRISVNQLAASLGYSTSGLQHLFRQRMGMSLTAYIQREKLRKAKYLLRYTDLTCAAISERLSFSSQSRFSALFRREVGITPMEYRRQGEFGGKQNQSGLASGFGME